MKHVSGLVPGLGAQQEDRWRVPNLELSWQQAGVVTCCLAAVAVAFVTVFLRCVYRIAEMVGGWANPIMRDEIGFDIMEGMYVIPSQIQGNNC